MPAALSAATGLAFDSSGNLYIAESTAYRLSRMTPDGTTTRYAGTGFNSMSWTPVPQAPNELDDPFAVTVDRFGTVYVADLAGQLQRITSNCTLSSPYFDAVSGVASDPQGTSISPTFNTAWYGDYPPAPGPSKAPTVPPSAARIALAWLDPARMDIIRAESLAALELAFLAAPSAIPTSISAPAPAIDQATATVPAIDDLTAWMD